MSGNMMFGEADGRNVINIANPDFNSQHQNKILNQ